MSFTVTLFRALCDSFFLTWFSRDFQWWSLVGYVPRSTVADTKIGTFAAWPLDPLLLVWTGSVTVFLITVICTCFVFQSYRLYVICWFNYLAYFAVMSNGNMWIMSIKTQIYSWKHFFCANSKDTLISQAGIKALLVCCHQMIQNVTYLHAIIYCVITNK